MRGGTSKAVFLSPEDLPPPGDGKDRLILEVFGSPIRARSTAWGSRHPHQQVGDHRSTVGARRRSRLHVRAGEHHRAGGRLRHHIAATSRRRWALCGRRGPGGAAGAGDASSASTTPTPPASSWPGCRCVTVAPSSRRPASTGFPAPAPHRTRLPHDCGRYLPVPSLTAPTFSTLPSGRSRGPSSTWLNLCVFVVVFVRSA